MSAPSPSDRAAVRALVQRNTDLLFRAAAAGEDVELLAIDLQDEVERFAATLPAEDAERFHAMYQEELEAQTSIARRQAAAAEADLATVQATATREGAPELVGRILGGVALVVVLYFLLGALLGA